VSALLTRYAHALVILKIFGGLYLLFLAYKAGRAALTSDEATARAAPNEGAKSASGWNVAIRMENSKRRHFPALPAALDPH